MTTRTTLEVEERGEGMVITLASGDDGNYLGTEDLAVLTSVFDDAENRDRRWILLRQRGRDFCLGRAPDEGGAETRRALIDFVQRMQRLGPVTVAAADGGCVGFGVGVFALTDISVAADSAWFQFPEILHGPAPAIVASWLFDRVPYKQGLYWTVTGAVFDAADALRFGLATKVVPAARVTAATDEIIEVLESVAPAALRNGKTAAHVMSTAPPDPLTRRAVALKWFL